METAVAVGVDRSHISKMESGSKQPSLEVLLRLAKHFDVDPNYLVGWPASGSPVQQEQPGENPDERALLAAFRRLLREERGVVEGVVRQAMTEGAKPPRRGGSRKSKDDAA